MINFRQPDHGHFFTASKGVDEKMFDAMNRVELQPLDQEFQSCAEGGLVQKVNLSPNSVHPMYTADLLVGRDSWGLS